MPNTVLSGQESVLRLFRSGQPDRSDRQGSRMLNRNYPTYFFIGLEDRVVREVGLRSSMELSVLSAIRCIALRDGDGREVGVSYKEIKLSIDCSHENLSKSLKALESHGLVNRRRDDNDRRVIRYQLTPEAWQIIAAADNFISQEIMRFMNQGGA